ncbi:LysE family translocator [Pseudomonas sp. 22-AL-CL-001]|uniref:LysE family translocator n=1 Tax=Pseudomonas alabamensis TaxID=3064349 RepID=UPI002713839C|nr:LysE family translocator [Pseudomonas sp. 22-AL-CL-001]MDO7911304.1 LysE family translocator [Pseudomonas sp. 22-AL-CL-001]
MNSTTLILFLPACFALNLAPGPNNLLSISNATRYGWGSSCLAGVGRLVAFALMIALASAGLAVVLQTSEVIFQAIKVGGGLYLLYLAYRLWQADTVAGGEASGYSSSNLWGLARQEFFVAAGNPKAILIFTAFLPQFIDPAQEVGRQLALLGALFLVLEAVAIGLYAYMGLHLRRWMTEPAGRRRFNRGCAVLLSLAASLLLTARRT